MMMAVEQLSTTELAKSPDIYVRRVKEGASFEMTEDGEPIAVLSSAIVKLVLNEPEAPA